MTKRFISWMLTLAMCLSLVSIPAMADGENTPSVTEAHLSSKTSVVTVKEKTYTVVDGTVAYVVEKLDPDSYYTVGIYQDTENNGETVRKMPSYMTTLKPDDDGMLSGTITPNDEELKSILQEIEGWYLGVIPVGESNLVAFKPLTKDPGFEPLPVIVKGPAYVDLELGPNPATATLDEATAGEPGETQIITVKISGDKLMASETDEGSGEYYAIGGVGIPHFDGVAYRGGWFASEDNKMPALDDEGWTVLTKTNGLITETVGEEPNQKDYDVFYLQLSPEILNAHKNELPYLCVTADGKNYIYKLDISAVKLATVTFDANGKDVGGDQTYMLHGDTELVRAGRLYVKAPVLEKTDNAVFKGWYLSTDATEKIVVDEKGELVEAEGDETQDATYTPGATYYPKWVKQYDVKIKVVEAKDETTPISGAEVKLGDVELSPVQDKPGVYATSAKVEAGKYALTVSKTLYGTHTDAEFEVGDKNYSTDDDAVIKTVTLTPIVYKVGVSLANGAGEIAHVYGASGDLGSYQLSDPDANNTYNVTGTANYIQMDEFLGVKKENDAPGTYTRGYYLAAHFTQPKYTEGTEEKTFTNGYKVAINGTEYNWAQAFDETVGNEKVLEIVKHIYNKEGAAKQYTVSFYLTKESTAPELTYTVNWSGVEFNRLQDFVIDKVTIDWDNENSVYVATVDSLPYGISLKVDGDKVKIDGTADEQTVKFAANVTFEKGDHVDKSLTIKKKSVSTDGKEVTFTLFGPLPVIVKGPAYADPVLQNRATAKLEEATAGEAGETQIITVKISGDKLMASETAQGSGEYYAIGGVGIPHFDGVVAYKGGWFASEDAAKTALNSQGWTDMTDSLTTQTIGEQPNQKAYDVFYLQLTPEILNAHKNMLPYLCATVDGKNYIYKLDISAVTLATVTFDANGTDEGGDETYMLHGDTELVRAGRLYVNAPVLEKTDNAEFKGWYLSTDDDKKIVVDETGALVKAEGDGTQNATYTAGATYYPKWGKLYGVEIKVVDAKDGTTLISDAIVKLGDVTLSPVEGKLGFYATTANVKEGTYKLTITKALYKSFEEEGFIVIKEGQPVDENGKISKTAQLTPIVYKVGVSLANGKDNIASVYGASGPLGSYNLSPLDEVTNTYYVTGTANYIQMDEFLGVKKEKDALGTYTRGYYLAAHFTQPKYTEGTEDKTFTNGYKVAINGTKYNWAQAFDETVGSEKVLEIVKHIYKQDAAKAYTISFYLTEESTAPELTYTVDWSGVTFGRLEDFVIKKVTIDWNEKDSVYVATADSLPYGISLKVEGDKVIIDGTADEQDVKFDANVTFEKGDHVDKSLTIKKKSVSENGTEVTFTLFGPLPVIVKGSYYADPALSPNSATATLDEAAAGEAGETQIITVKISGDKLMASETAQGSGEYYAVGGVGIPHFEGVVAYKGGWFASEDAAKAALNSQGWTVLTNRLTTETVGEEPNQKTYDVFYLQLSPELLNAHKNELPYLCATVDGKNYIYKLDISAVTLATVTFDANGKDVGGDETYMLHGDTELVRAGELVVNAPVLESTDNAEFKGWYLSTDADKKIVVDENGALVKAEGAGTQNATYTAGATYYPKWAKQYGVEIKVVDAKDETTPISDAEVKLGDVTLSPVEGKLGFYATTANVKEGTYKLTITKALYKPFEEEEFIVSDEEQPVDESGKISKTALLTPVEYTVGVSLANGANNIASVYGASGALGSYTFSQPVETNTYKVTGTANYIQMDEFFGVKKENDAPGTYTRGYYLAAHFTQPKYTEGTEDKTFTNGYMVAIGEAERPWADAFDETRNGEKVLEFVKHIYNKQDADKAYTVSFYLTEESYTAKKPDLAYTVDWSGVTFGGLQDFVISKVTIDWNEKDSVYVATADSLPYGISLKVEGDKVIIDGTADEQDVKFAADVTFEKGDTIDESITGIEKKSVSTDGKEVTFTLVMPEPPVVAAPKIVYNEDGTLSLQAENGAEIYYTTNGDDVDTAATPSQEALTDEGKPHGLMIYNGEKIKITMNHVSTIKAVAILNGVTSEQLEFNKPVLDKDTTQYTANSGKLPVQIAHYDDYAEYMNGKLYFGFQYQKQYTVETSTLRGGMTLTFDVNDMTFPENALLVEVWIFDKPVNVNNSAEVSAHLVDAYKWAGQN